MKSRLLLALLIRPTFFPDCLGFLTSLFFLFNDDASSSKYRTVTNTKPAQEKGLAEHKYHHTTSKDAARLGIRRRRRLTAD